MAEVFPQWIDLSESPPQESYLEQRIFAEWCGTCPHCGVLKCLAGWIPCIHGHQDGVPVKVGDGVVIRARPSNSAKIISVVCILTRVRATYMKGRPILVGGTVVHSEMRCIFIGER